MVGATITGTARRGKILWLILDERDALLTHLGMSEDDAGAASERV